MAGRKRLENMNPTLVAEATKIISDPHILVNMVSKRVRQLSAGQRPMVPTTVRMGYADIALEEIIQGKLAYQSEPTAVPGTR